jgi:hypothetical protein
VNILKTVEDEQVIFKSRNIMLTITFDVINDAKFYGYDLLNEQFIESIFKTK